MTERIQRREHFAFFCPAGRESEAKEIIADINRIRLVPRSFERSGPNSHTITSSEGFLVKGVASTPGALRRLLHQFNNSRIAGYSQETALIKIDKRSPEDRRLYPESETHVEFTDEGILEVQHLWGKIRINNETTYSHILALRSQLGQSLTSLEDFYGKSRRQYFKLVEALEKYREGVPFQLKKRVALDWTIERLKENTVLYEENKGKKG